MFGDPHISTFDDLRFDCQAEGEFVMVKSADLSFQVQERFTAIPTTPLTVDPLDPTSDCNGWSQIGNDYDGMLLSYLVSLSFSCGKPALIISCMFALAIIQARMSMTGQDGAQP